MENKFEGMDVKTIISKTRHKAELPLKFLANIVTVTVFFMAGVIGLLAKSSEDFKSAFFETLAESEAYEMAETIESFIDLGFGCSIALIGLIIALLLFSFYRMYAQVISYSVKVTPENFPEIYNKGVEFTEKLGLKKQPEIYIQQDNGVLNAFATYIIGKRYVQLNAEMVDIAYMENKDFDTLYFVMAHEFGHIYLKHVTLSYNLFTFIWKMIPILSGLLSRAQEYSADRVAQALTDNKNASECMLLLTAGRHLYKYTNVDDYIKSAEENHNSLERLARFIVNMNATHPITPFRTKAILDEDRKSGRLL